MSDVEWEYMGPAAADGTRPVHRATEDQLRALKRRGEVNGDTALRSNPDAPWTTLGVIFPNLRPAPPPGKWSDMARGHGADTSPGSSTTSSWAPSSGW